jgi:hypothetical protein
VPLRGAVFIFAGPCLSNDDFAHEIPPYSPNCTTLTRTTAPVSKRTLHTAAHTCSTSARCIVRPDPTQHTRTSPTRGVRRNARKPPEPALSTPRRRTRRQQQHRPSARHTHHRRPS